MQTIGTHKILRYGLLMDSIAIEFYLSIEFRL